jgi:arylsulfatase A-like enzyme
MGGARGIRGRVAGLALIGLVGVVGLVGLVLMSLTYGSAPSPTPSAVAAAPRATATASRPNIVLILTDDQRWDSLGEMPATNARSWRRFTRSFVVEPMCCPSRASTLTGRIPSHTGVDTLLEGARLNERKTLATMLHAAGYHTVFAGKYLNNWPYSRKPYTPPGWDRFYAFRGDDKYYDYTLVENGRSVRYGIQPDDYSTDVFARKVVHAIAVAKRDQPLLVEFAPYAPHRDGVLDATPAPRHVGACAAAEFPRPANFNVYDRVSEPAWMAGELPKVEETVVRMRRATCETLRAVDEAVTAIFDALARAGRLANTYVVVTSDNGYHLGEHRLFSKGDLYEESIRVPLLVRGPGVRPASDARLTSNIDLAPTFLDWARVKPPGHFFDGSSFAASARDAKIAGPAAVLLRGCRTGGAPTTGGGACGSHFTNMGKNWGLRTARYKYVEYRDGYRQLFDLVADPGEVRNLAPNPAYAATIVQLHKRLVALRGRP